MSDPTDKGGLLIKHQIKPSASGVRITMPVYARATSLLSRAEGGALLWIMVKQPGALLEQVSSWRIA